MFEAIFYPRTAERYRTAPLSESRTQYLRHLNELGACRTTLRKTANDQLSLIRLLDLREGDRVSVLQIEAAAAIWALPKGHRYARAASPKARTRFVSRGIQWLRFLGWLDEPEHQHHPHHAEIAIFEGWLRTERGLSGATIQSYCVAADHFFFWLAGRGVSLSAIRMTDIDDVIAREHRRGAWSRRTMHDYAQRLRAFFLFAEARGWCRAGLAAGIMAPRFMADETVPKGIKRDDALRLLASVRGDRPVDKRDRAILMLFIAYGLRAGEVSGLQLDDLDWENAIVRVRCPKPGRTHSWPLSPSVGDAILRYIRGARPTGLGRSLFFTSHAPIRPVGRKTLGKIVRDRLAGIGIVTGRRGTHALRHSAAQHLLDQGMSMKVIGDFLGHRDPSSTAIYAKVNLAALREVAALDLEGLGMTLREAIGQYILWRQAHGAKFTTGANLLRHFLGHVDGDAACDAVTTAQVLAFLAGQGPLTRQRENKYYALAGFWRHAISRGHATSSPLPDNEPRSPVRAPPYIYSRNELRRLFDPATVEFSRQGAVQVDAVTFRTLLLLLYGAGLRFSEATGLTLADVDLAEATLTIPKLAGRTITPHVIRHTTACHLVLAGVDINTIRAWLGHVSISTTNIYAEIDLTLKANAVALCEVAQQRPGRSWKEDKDLMAFLKSL